MIYIHIPFCKQKCSYCNFHFSTSTALKDDMLIALKKELLMRKHELQHTVLQSLYFGGGTPSLFTVDELQNLMDEVLKYFTFSPDIEITLEANPDDLDPTYVKALSTSYINRLSIGVQSFFDEDLQLMNRAHNSNQADAAIKRSQDFGLENISIDLIYGSPTSNFEKWKQNLNKTLELQVPHVSSYALTIEPKTALNNWVEKGKISPPNEAVQNEEFYFMSEFLQENGFDHYEISNFGKPEFHSKHNSAYWEYKEYLGIGPSAHSYNGIDCRSWNISNNLKYIQQIEKGILPLEKEVLSQKDQINEMLMIGLRTKKGVNLDNFERIAVGFKEKLQILIDEKLQEGKLINEGGFLKIPTQHWFLADGIASDLFLLD